MELLPFSAIIAGCLAASASSFAKLALDENAPLMVFVETLDLHMKDEFKYATRIVCLGIMFSLNTLMMSFNIKALQDSNSVVVTVTTNAVNFIFSAILGFFLFNETHSFSWFIGSCFIISGVCLLVHGSNSAALNGEGDKKKRN